MAIVGVLAGGWAPVADWALAAGPAVDVAPHCRVPDDLVDTRPPLPLTMARLGAGQSLVIVAIGSSSTAGAGASHPSASYPARLRDELARRFPDAPITVVNKGAGGETARRMIARFERDVIALNPHLVIWQTGTNSALRDHDPAQFRREIADGIRTLRQAGVDVILMAPQFAPRFNDLPNRMAFVRAVDDVAGQAGAVLFPRHAIMKYWIESGRFDFKTMLSPDGLHLNDLSYDCVAQLLAEQIETIVRPLEVARSAR
jgi:lysophospholipase L1-like esterase